MSRVLVTGASGLLGSWLLRTAPADVELVAVEHRTPVEADTATIVHADLADPEQTRAMMGGAAPEVVIHAAYSQLDPARNIVAASRNVAAACARVGARLVHLSSDVVFDGERAPYREGARPAPVHDYGLFKAEAEQLVLDAMPDAAIVRTSLITWADPPDPRTAWVLEGLRGDGVTLFTDEVRCPIAADDLAVMLWEIAGLPREAAAGPWHLVGPDALSRVDLGRMIAAWAGLSPERITESWSIERDARRPRDLRLLDERANQELGHRPRSMSELFVPSGAAPQPNRTG